MKYTLDYEKYTETARKAVSDGQVLLENRYNVLPIPKGETVALLGRMQFHYYKSGTGSGGMVNVNRVIGIYDALKEIENDTGVIKVYEPLCDIYREWEKTNPVVEGVGWGMEPNSQAEMPLSDEVLEEAAPHCYCAVCVIARIAGEDADNKYTKGCYLLTDEEMDMLKKARRYFERVVVVINSGNAIDMRFVKETEVDAVLYAWQGGMIGGLGTADALTGAVNPSGKLTDTLAYSLEDYPSYANFGDSRIAKYEEDVYVGYRYFETFAKDKVLYPFGYGLSYTDFNIETDSVCLAKDYLTVDINVTNVGMVSGREVVQVYVEAPQGLLGKPSRVLAGFVKTPMLQPGCSKSMNVDMPFRNFASFDETGACGLGTGFVLEQGSYGVCVGSDVRSARHVGNFIIEENVMVEKLQNALGPVEPLRRMKPSFDEEGRITLTYEDAPLRADTQKERRDANIPKEIPMTGDLGYKLSDVLNKKVTMEEFIGQLDKEELSIIVRGEGMSSKQVTPGTAAAFGGIVPSLKEKGIPVGCMDDGPSGMRLDSGIKAFSLPNGTCLACTFDPELNEELFEFLGVEMLKNKVDVLLGPGMNIHRHPLNGRNFEYFSEDPLVTGLMGAAQLRGLKKSNVTGTIKHFACNNQEDERRFVNPVVSERALREIYLRGFEIAVKNGKADSVMTTYGLINGVWTAGCYDLNTTILRNQWGFKGIVMTDWWAFISEEGSEHSTENFAAMVRAQNDLYCCVPLATADVGDNVLSSLEDGSLSISELQRTAVNVCEFLMNQAIMEREFGEGIDVEVIGATEGFDDVPKEVEYILTGSDGEEDCVTIDLSHLKPTNDYSFYFGVEAKRLGSYKITIEGRGCAGNELAQMAVVMFSNSTPCGSFTYRGDGVWKTDESNVYFFTPRNILKLYFNLGGVEMKSVKFERVGD